MKSKLQNFDVTIPLDNARIASNPFRPRTLKHYLFGKCLERVEAEGSFDKAWFIEMVIEAGNELEVETKFKDYETMAKAWWAEFLNKEHGNLGKVWQVVDSQ